MFAIHAAQIFGSNFGWKFLFVVSFGGRSRISRNPEITTQSLKSMSADHCEVAAGRRNKRDPSAQSAIMQTIAQPADVKPSSCRPPTWYTQPPRPYCPAILPPRRDDDFSAEDCPAKALHAYCCCCRNNTAAEDRRQRRRSLPLKQPLRPLLIISRDIGVVETKRQPNSSSSSYRLSWEGNV